MSWYLLQHSARGSRPEDYRAMAEPDNEYRLAKYRTGLTKDTQHERDDSVITEIFRNVYHIHMLIL